MDAQVKHLESMPKTLLNGDWMKMFLAWSEWKTEVHHLFWDMEEKIS
jgi:hypothetical protein